MTQPTALVTWAGLSIPGVIAIETTHAYDAFCATAKVTTAIRPTFKPDDWNQIIIYEGYGGSNSQVFTGYVDKITAGSFPNTWDIECRDVLKRAVDTWLDDIGLTYSNKAPEDIACSLLSFAGLGATVGTSGVTCATQKEWPFKLMSISDAVQQVQKVIGWHTWANWLGGVLFQYLKPRPASTSSFTYIYGRDFFDYKYVVTDENLRNRAVVMGNGTLKTQASAASYYIYSPPTWRTAIDSTPFLDTQTLVDGVGGQMIQDLDSLTYSVEFTMAGAPDLHMGQTIHLTIASEEIDANAFVFSVKSEMKNDGSYVTKVVAVWWDLGAAANFNDEGSTAPYGGPIGPGPGPIQPPYPPPDTVTYDVGGGLDGDFDTEQVQRVGLPNGATWSKAFVSYTGTATWTIKLNGATIASGSGPVNGPISTVSFAGGSSVRFDITPSGTCSNLDWGVGA